MSWVMGGSTIGDVSVPPSPPDGLFSEFTSALSRGLWAILHVRHWSGGDSLVSIDCLGGWKTSFLALASFLVVIPLPSRLAPSGGCAHSVGRRLPVLPGVSLHSPSPSLRSRGVRVGPLF